MKRSSKYRYAWVTEGDVRMVVWWWDIFWMVLAAAVGMIGMPIAMTLSQDSIVIGIVAGIPMGYVVTMLGWGFHDALLNFEPGCPVKPIRDE